jgi:hypothetical protein
MDSNTGAITPRGTFLDEMITALFATGLAVMNRVEHADLRDCDREPLCSAFQHIKEAIATLRRAGAGPAIAQIEGPD